MKRLEKQLAEYGDFHEDEQGPISPLDIIAPERSETAVGSQLIRPDQGLEESPAATSRTGWWVGVVAAIAAVVFISLVPLWLGSGEVQPADPPTDTIVAVTTQPEVFIEEATEPYAEIRVETSFGGLTWTELAGDENTVPAGEIQLDPEGNGYLVQERGRIWRSQNGLVWNVEEAFLDLGNYEHVFIEGRWAFAYTEDGIPTMFERRDESWEPLSLPELSIPGIDGVRWWTAPGLPIESGGIVVIPAVGNGMIPWEDYYGTFEVECAQASPCPVPVDVWWDEISGEFQVHNPETGGLIARLEMTVDANTIIFSDSESGEPVHTITARSESEAAEYARQIQQSGGIAFSASLVSVAGNRFDVNQVPWRGFTQVLAVQSGGFVAYETSRDSAPGTSPVASATVWTSEDGVNWIHHGTPTFLTGLEDDVWVHEQNGKIVANVTIGNDRPISQRFSERWESTNGLGWMRVATGAPGATNIFEIDQGYVAAYSNIHTRFWVSIDGENWEEVPGPPGFIGSSFSSYSGNGAVGNLLYYFYADNYLHADDAGDRSLWIGTFDR